MSTKTEPTLAEKHATSILKSIQERCNNGAPFGYVNTLTGEHCSDFDDLPLDATEPGTKELREDGGYQEASGYDYLRDVLDIHYTIGSDRAYRSARVLISFGGPNVWIDTRTGELEVYWGDSVTKSLPREFVNGLDEALAELWEMGA